VKCGEAGPAKYCSYPRRHKTLTMQNDVFTNAAIPIEETSYFPQQFITGEVGYPIPPFFIVLAHEYS